MLSTDSSGQVGGHEGVEQSGMPSSHGLSRELVAPTILCDRLAMKPRSPVFATNLLVDLLFDNLLKALCGQFSTFVRMSRESFGP